MKAAVTGATGFIAGHLAAALLGRGDRVRCLVRSRARTADLAALGAELVDGDLEDEDALRSLVDGADVVFHAACAAPHDSDPRRVNVDGTRRLLAKAHGIGVSRFVYLSSLAVSGPSRPGRPHREAGAAHPLTPYAASKQGGEDAVRAGGVPFTILRPAVTYGAGDRQLLEVFRFARNGWSLLLGDGDQELSLVEVGDLCRAMLAVLASPAAAGKTYHVADDAVVTQAELSKTVARALGRPTSTVRLAPWVVRAALRVIGGASYAAGVQTPLRFDRAPEFLAAAWTATSADLQRDTGWGPQMQLHDGLQATADWYRRKGWL